MSSLVLISLETLKIQKEKMIPVIEKEIENCQKRFNEDIVNGHWINATYKFNWKKFKFERKTITYEEYVNSRIFNNFRQLSKSYMKDKIERMDYFINLTENSINKVIFMDDEVASGLFGIGRV